MTEEKKTGGPAFPLFDGSAHYGGMTLRDWFAGKALQGLIAGAKAPVCHLLSENPNASEIAYKFADAMLKAREE